MGETLLALVAIFGFCGGIAVLIFSVQQVKREEIDEAGEGWFRPVGLSKFLVLTTVTIGTYSLYWFWRSWRRYWVTEGADIRPFWRTFFSVFWIVSLFQAANEKTETKWPVLVPMIVTAVYLVTNAAVQLGMQENAPFWQTEAVSAISALAFVPLVIQINRVNDPEFVARRSRFSKMDWWALVCGLPLWASLMIME